MPDRSQQKEKDGGVWIAARRQGEHAREQVRETRGALKHLDACNACNLPRWTFQGDMVEAA